MTRLRLAIFLAALLTLATASAAGAATTTLKYKTNWANGGLFTYKTGLKYAQQVTECSVAGTGKLIAEAVVAKSGSNRQYIAFKIDKRGKLVGRGKGRHAYVKVGNPKDRRVATTIDGNGHIYFAYTRIGSDDVYLSRTKTDLTADRSFGAVKLPRPLARSGDYSFSQFRGVVIFPQFDGGVLIAVQTGATSSIVSRIAPNNKIDAGFGNAGSVELPAQIVRSISARPGTTEPIFLAGTSAAGRAQVTAITAKGAIDTTYGVAGIADLGGTSVSSRLDETIAESDGGLIAKRFHKENDPGAGPGQLSLFEDVVRIKPGGSLDTGFGGSGAINLLRLGASSDNAPDQSVMPLHAAGDNIFAGYFASRIATSLYGSYYWLNQSGKQLGFPHSAPNFLTKKRAIVTNEAIPALRGGFYACGALTRSFSSPYRIAIARYAP